MTDVIPPSSFGPGFGGEHDKFVPHLASDTPYDPLDDQDQSYYNERVLAADPGTYWRVAAPDIDGTFGE